MGDKNVSSEFDEQNLRSFTKAVLNDLHALEKMLAGEMLSGNVCRIEAEQEMFLVNSALHPAALALDVIERAKDRRLTTEKTKS